jgi:hypothetical protein
MFFGSVRVVIRVPHELELAALLHLATTRRCRSDRAYHRDVYLAVTPAIGGYPSERRIKEANDNLKGLSRNAVQLEVSKGYAAGRLF